LFEDPRPCDTAKIVVGTPEHREVALRAAREGLVLLENRAKFLPINPDSIRKICVVGPNADNPVEQNGDWSLCRGGSVENYPKALSVTALRGIRTAFPGAEVTHIKGSNVEAAREADLIIVIVSDRYRFYGEWKSTATLEPDGTQVEVLKAIIGLNKPFIIDFIATKPLVLPEDVVAKASAIIQQFSPGMLGGVALGEALTGKLNPCGKLPISIPRHAGQIPTCYNLTRGSHGGYADIDESPYWGFGHGLS